MKIKVCFRYAISSLLLLFSSISLAQNSGVPANLSIKETVSPKGVLFGDLQALLQIPQVCRDARDAYKSTAGTDPLHQRAVLTGRVTEGPICGELRRCGSELSNQVERLISYLRQHPRYLNEVVRLGAGTSMRPDQIVPHMIDGLRRVQSARANERGWQDCGWVSITIDSYLYPIRNGAGSSRDGLEAFSLLANKVLQRMHLDYDELLAKYNDWLPYSKHYASANHLALLIQQFNQAYSASDVEEILQLIPSIQQAELLAGLHPVWMTPT